MVGMKTFGIVNSIACFSLLSSNSARPMMGITHPTFVDNPQTTNDVRALESSATHAPHLHNNEHSGTSSPEEQLDSSFKKAEESLTKLRDTRMTALVAIADYSAKGAVSTSSTHNQGAAASKAVEATLRGIQSEKDAYSALAQGHFQDVDQLYWKAAMAQHEARKWIEDAGALGVELIRNEKIQTATKDLAEQALTYRLLPTITELKEVAHSFNNDYSAPLHGSIVGKNQHEVALVEDQETWSRTKDQDTLQLAQHQDTLTQPLLKAQDQSSGSKMSTKSMLKMFGELPESTHGYVLRTHSGILDTTMNLQKAQALAHVKIGNKEQAVKMIKKMEDTRKQGLVIREQYKDHVQGPMDMEKFNRWGYEDSMRKLKTVEGPEPFHHRLSSLKLEDVKKRLGLNV